MSKKQLFPLWEVKVSTSPLSHQGVIIVADQQASNAMLAALHIVRSRTLLHAMLGVPRQIGTVQQESAGVLSHSIVETQQVVCSCDVDGG